MSNFNFKEFTDGLKPNVKNSLCIFLLQNVGLRIRTEDSSLIMELSDADSATEFYTWLHEREKYLQSKGIGIVENV
jgi:hypothetical protein